MYRLEEFEGDEMWDYEGWDFLHEETDPEEEIAWRFQRIISLMKRERLFESFIMEGKFIKLRLLFLS